MFKRRHMFLSLLLLCSPSNTAYKFVIFSSGNARECHLPIPALHGILVTCAGTWIERGLLMLRAVAAKPLDAIQLRYRADVALHPFIFVSNCESFCRDEFLPTLQPSLKPLTGSKHYQ